ncbi:right-handed parallel beta-helix repeat-containing protein [bacterium]|nr:right-handed parallel beta-helix repeat-containing protein [bacterium]
MRSRNLQLAMIMVAVVCMSSIAVAANFYVDTANGDDGDTGADWGHAFASINTAMAACSGTSADAIHVAAGTYFESINLKSYVTLLGGYPAGGGSRDYMDNPTILDGGGSHTLVTFVSVSDCEIDGFRLQDGYSASGGAILCNGASPIIGHCIITDNSAVEGAGFHLDGSDPEINHCRIVGNDATGNGGGLYCDNSSPTFWDTVIAENTSGGNGGGIFFDNSPSNVLTNCLVIENTASGDGGGLFCDKASSTIINSTFSRNEAGGVGGGIFLGSKCHPVVINSIFWGDGPDEISGADNKKNSLDITYSNVQQDGYGVEGDTCTADEDHNINCEPEFRTRGEETEHDGYFLDKNESPSVDSGNTDENPYGGSSNPKFTTHTEGYNDMTGGDDVNMGYHYNADEDITYVNLVAFEAKPGRGSIILSWETGAEIDNAGFVLFRSMSRGGDFGAASDLIQANGTPASGAHYEFHDRHVRPDVEYTYYLVDIDTSGAWTVHGPVMARCLSWRLERLDLRNAQVLVR